jgi:hypothetical protein
MNVAFSFSPHVTKEVSRGAAKEYSPRRKPWVVSERRPSPGGAAYSSPKPALSLPKGRKSWVSARRDASSPGGTTRSHGVWSGHSCPLPLILFWDFASRLCEQNAPGRARLQPCRQSPISMRASAPEARRLHPSIRLPPSSFRHAS